MGGEDGWWRWGTCPDKVREKAGMDRSISEVSPHCEELGLSMIFSIHKFYSSPLHVLQLDLICPVSVHVSDYPRVLEID